MRVGARLKGHALYGRVFLEHDAAEVNDFLVRAISAGTIASWAATVAELLSEAQAASSLACAVLRAIL
jgi:hypothetical protein